jgi:tetratricopeptide (TPR) repeat protein
MKKITIILFTMFSFFNCGQKKTNERYFTWEEFTKNFGKEMVSAEDVFNNMSKNGLKNNCLTKMDFTFVSDKKENLIKLTEFIKSHYPYSVQEIKKFGKLWEINGETNEIPITKDNLMYWALDLCKRGYEFDSTLDAYGGLSDPKNQTFPDLEKTKEDFYFDNGIKDYENGNLNGALINWTLSLTINPNSADSYYSRAIVKNELYTWKSALRDYDKAIELEPDFINAIMNRGTVKDENEDYLGAIEDYYKVLSFKNVDIENQQRSYFNRGNTYFNLKKNDEACKDWKKSFELGAEYAKERIDKYCK